MTRKAGVLINPTAGRNNGKGLRLAAALGRASHVELRLLESFGQLRGHLESLAAAGVTDLFISSGDGTIQAIQSLLAETRMFATLPRLCLLPHGTTNLTGIDVGLRITAIERQARAIIELPPPQTARRHSLRIANPADGQPRHGMTLGAGAAARATRHAQLAYNDKGVKGPLANFATIAGSLGRAAMGRATSHDTDRIDRPCIMEIRHEGQLVASGPQLMFVATTLQRLFFRTRPFWGGQRGPVRASVIPHPVPNVLRWALPLMYGSETRATPKGAHSISGTSFEISCEEAFVMDGEFFEGPKTGLLQVSAGPEFEFIIR